MGGGGTAPDVNPRSDAADSVASFGGFSFGFFEIHFSEQRFRILKKLGFAIVTTKGDDNPFMNSGLSPIDGFTRNRTFCVDGSVIGG